ALAKSLAGAFAGLLDGLRSNRPERRVAARDLLLARRVQQHFLPQSALRIPGYSVAEAYVPARAVGGDHYEFFRYRDHRTGIIIADVSGKAVSAALVMARFGMAVRLLASQASGPLELLVTLNILLLDELETGMFVTAQALALSAEDGQLEIANAGHPLPLLRSHVGSVEALILESGAPLGADARTAFRSSAHAFEAGACLLLYTDGLDEAENDRGEALGIERVIAGIRTCSDARTVLEAVNATHAAFVGSAAPTDDLTLIALGRDAGP
ncbi:MAG: SpoIIE family protein phosphatase, partial [Dokdonella sp.]